MIKRRYLIILILFFTFGVMVEGLKKLAGITAPTDSPAGLISFQKYDLIKPFHVVFDTFKSTFSDSQNRKSRGGSGGIKLANVEATLPQQYDFSEGHTVAANEAEKKKNETPKTEETVKKKKKKKKKRGRDQADLNKTNPDENEKPKEPKTEDDKSGSKAEEEDYSGGYVVVVADNPNKLPVTYEDWAKLILGTPSIENVTKLIEYFQNNMVTAEVFYAILNAMMEESNPEQHKLAIFAASQVQNPSSFKFLVEVLKAESQGTELGNKIGQHINAYQSLGAVAHMNEVLNENLNDPVIMQVAITVVDNSTRIHLEDREPTPEPVPNITPAPNATTPTATPTPKTDADKERIRFEQRRAQARRIFMRFAPTLAHVIATYSTQREIADPAEHALSRIKNLSIVVGQTND